MAFSGVPAKDAAVLGKIFLSLLSAVVVGVVIWSGKTLSDTAEQVARMEERSKLQMTLLEERDAKQLEAIAEIKQKIDAGILPNAQWRMQIVERQQDELLERQQEIISTLKVLETKVNEISRGAGGAYRPTGVPRNEGERR